MKTPARSVLTGIALAATVALASSAARAQDPKDLGWKDTAELSFVLTSGNARSNTLGFKNTLSRATPKTLFTFRTSGIRAVSTDTIRHAVGTPDDFELVESTTSRVSAEKYNVSGQYEWRLRDGVLWSATAGWDRDRFAGIENRFVVGFGVGNMWFNREKLRWKTEYSATWTSQETVTGNPERFVGARLLSDIAWKLGPNAGFQNVIILDENLSRTAAWRGDMTTSVTATMTRRLALKASLQWLYSNRPPGVSVPLEDDAGAATGQTVVVALKKMDQVFTTSLVMNF